MKLAIPATVLMLALAGCSSQGRTASEPADAKATMPAPATAYPDATPRQAGNPTTSSNIAMDLRFSGRAAGRMTHAQIQDSLCGPPNSPISAVLKGELEGQPVTLQIVINKVAPADAQAVVVMTPPPGIATPPPSSTFGQNVAAWSTYGGRAVIEADGRSASISADLSAGDAAAVEHLTGWWRCAAESA